MGLAVSSVLATNTAHRRRFPLQSFVVTVKTCENNRLRNHFLVTTSHCKDLVFTSLYLYFLGLERIGFGKNEHMHDIFAML